MKKSDVMALLEENRNERGVANWENLGEGTGGLESCGIGLTQLRKFAKKIGRDHGLALELWETPQHEAKVIGLLVDDPKQLTREQAEKQVEEVGAGMLAHVYSSCDATLAKAPFAFDLATDWIESEDPLRRQCGWGLLYELSKKPKHKGMTDEFCLTCIERIGNSVLDEVARVRGSMAAALMGIGKRNRMLNKAAIKVAKAIGPVSWDDDTNCEPFDVLKHLTSDYIKQKLGT